MNLICSQFTVNSDRVWKIYLKIRTHTFSIGKEFILRRYKIYKKVDYLEFTTNNGTRVR